MSLILLSLRHVLPSWLINRGVRKPAKCQSNVEKTTILKVTHTHYPVTLNWNSVLKFARWTNVSVVGVSLTLMHRVRRVLCFCSFSTTSHFLFIWSVKADHTWWCWNLDGGPHMLVSHRAFHSLSLRWPLVQRIICHKLCRPLSLYFIFPSSFSVIVSNASHDLCCHNLLSIYFWVCLCTGVVCFQFSGQFPYITFSNAKPYGL